MNPALSNDELFKTLTEIYQEKILELKSLKVTISSGSMRPLIKPGELIICESKPEYKTGDIIVFFNGSKIIAHRIILIEGNKISAI